MNAHFDALICGGGLAGLTLARQLHRDFDSIRIGVVEKTHRPLPDGAHKVGESTVELGSQYLERLGLKDYLLEHHLVKFGLRFFTGDGHLPISARTEIGPINNPIVRSYQIDRGRFESDLRGMLEQEARVDLMEGTQVLDISLNSGANPHEITVESGHNRHQLTADWVIDATGRTGLLRGRLKLRRGGRHTANAGWFRVKGRVDITHMADATQSRWHQVPESQHRWLSTNHLMGIGYWVWVIPLSNGMTSIGVVTHDHVHNFDRVRNLDSVRTFLDEFEPHFSKYIADNEVVDFRCLKNYCNTVSRCWHPDGWAIVGEAGAFTDPLYSPGTDYIALANTFTSELIRVKQDTPEKLLTRTQELNAQYRALVNGSIGVYRESASVYGHPEAMATKVFWDNHVYWSFPCQFYQQDIYRLSGKDLEPFTHLGARFVELSGYIQLVLKFWSEHSNQSKPSNEATGAMFVIPGFPSMLVDAHCALEQKLTPQETLKYMSQQLTKGEELFSEIVLRVSTILGPVLGKEMWSELNIHTWGVELPSNRIHAEELEGRARWRALSLLSRDVERALGRPSAAWRMIDIKMWLDKHHTEVA